MKPVLTVADLDGVAPGGEVSVVPGTLITPLAREEAGRRGIQFRPAAPAPLPGDSPADPDPAPAPQPPPAQPPPPEPPAAVNPPVAPAALEGLVRAVTDEVLRCLGIGTPAAPCGVAAPGAGPVSLPPSAARDEAALAALIDHTLLKPEASRPDIEQLCEEALRFGFAVVCVNPWQVPLAVERTHGSNVRVCTVVGFPLGATLPRVKIFEAEEAAKLGAREIDMVQNVGALRSGRHELVEADIRGVVQAAHRGGAICKVILETSLLTREEKVRAALAARSAGADFVKTSTGFSSSGATAEDVALLRATVGQRMGVKASGGIRTLDDLRRMVAAGATRIGTSSGVSILREARRLAGLPPPPDATPGASA